MKLDILSVINDDSSIFEGSLLVADIVSSTALKNISEPAWLGVYARIFHILIEQIPPQGELVKFLGDGFLVVFDSDNATEVINTAIRMQEVISQENLKEKIKIGIASGNFRRIPMGDGKFDYLGTVVDKAFRLCDVAQEKAILIDKDTRDMANTRKIESNAGRAETPKRREYIKEGSAASLKGISEAVEIFDVYWAQDRYALKTQALAENQTKNSDPVKSDHIDEHKKGNVERGVFDHWIQDGRAGFIQGESERFIVSKSSSVNSREEIFSGDILYFIPIESKKSREATNVIKIGDGFNGRIVNSPVGKAFGFIASDALTALGYGNIYCADISGFNQGEDVKFKISETINRKTGKMGISSVIIR